MKNRSHDGLAANNLVPRATILLTCGRDRELWPDPIFWACAECSFHILSQSDLPDLTKSVSRGLPVLDKARALDPCRRSEWSWALGMRMNCTGPIVAYWQAWMGYKRNQKMHQFKQIATELLFWYINIPSASTSLIISWSSASVGFWPRDLITVPSSLVVIVPSPSLSNSENASLNSANQRQETNFKC